MHVSQALSVALLGAGFVPEFYPEEWEDDGGPESGPHLSGHPDTQVYELEINRHALLEVSIDHRGVQVDTVPNWNDE